MTSTFTASQTFTITDARYVTSKLGADLGYLRAVYGRPSQSQIDEYVEEVAQILKHGYLSTVDFGFKDGDAWKLRLRYRATAGNQLQDMTPGGIRTTINAAGLSFYSYLCFNDRWHALTPTEREAFEKTLPFVRKGAPEPTVGVGTTTTGVGYGRNGHGLTRDVWIDLT
jgi:hypothetical protein